MPLQNRVTPFSKLEHSPHRGRFMGNRGILHNADKNLVTQTWRHKNWVICNLTHTDKKGRSWHREVMSPHHYTELFFLDEVTALAAGHRPCALCRRAAFQTYKNLTGFKNHSAKELDIHLHKDRAQFILGNTPYPECAPNTMPDGVMLMFKNTDQHVYLKKDNHLWRWSHQGYDQPIPIPCTYPSPFLNPGTSPSLTHSHSSKSSGKKMRVITPLLTIKVLQSGYQPQHAPFKSEG